MVVIKHASMGPLGLCSRQSALLILNGIDSGACRSYEHTHTHFHAHSGMHIKHPLLICHLSKGLLQQMLSFGPLGLVQLLKTEEDDRKRDDGAWVTLSPTATFDSNKRK